MNGHKNHDSVDVYGTLNFEELEARAAKIAAFSLSAATAGNTIVVFTMLILQEIIEQLAVNPLENVSTIAQLSNSIALLNSSMKIIP